MPDTESFSVMFGPEEKTIPVICSWCKKVFDTKRWMIPHGKATSPDYGICVSCLDHVKKSIRTSSNGQMPTRKSSILIVDDEGNFCGMLYDLLHPLGYRIIICGGGEDAIEYYAKLHEDIDVVLLDMKMPEINGYTTFVNMKQINPDIKAIVMTGYARDCDIREILAAGALCVLEKPFDPLILMQRIKDVCPATCGRPLGS